MEEINISDFLRDPDNLSATKKINLEDFFEEDVRWYNEESQQMLNSGYFLRGETLFDSIHRICWAMSKQYPEFRILAYNNFVRNVVLGWQSYSSPIWSNAGTKRGLPISCFGVYVDDNMVSITDKLSETIIQTKLGGGTSGYFGGLRAKGVPVKDNGTSSGSVSFMQLWNTSMSVVSQGSCYKEGTEVLTQFGYVDFRNVIKGYHKIYQVNDKNIGSFTDDYELTNNNYTGKMYNIKGDKTENFHNLIVTGNHRMVINRQARLKENNYKGKKYWEETNKIVTAEKLKFHRDNRLPVSSYINNNSEIGLSLVERLKIAYQADGVKSKETHKIRFHFSKERKINRLSDLLNQANISFENIIRTNYGSTEISFDPQMEINKHSNFEWINLENVSLKWCKEFLDELKNWDGCQPEDREHFTYSSIDYLNIEKIQAIASICGFRVSYSQRPESETKQVLHKLTIFENTIYKSGDVLKSESYEVIDEPVYCCIVPEGRIMVKYDNHITQCGNTRRGNFAAYLDIDHGDIEDFLNIKSVGNPIQNLFYGVNVPDWWMQSMMDGDMEKRTLWAKILESRQEKGLPYILYSDTVNRNKPEIYKELNETIYGSNLCFSGDTIIAIADGTNGKTIKELAEFSQGKIKFPVYCATDKLQKNSIGKTNGGVIKNYNWKSEIKNAVAFKTGTKKVIEITLSNGDKFKCTDNHELALKSGGYIEASKSLNKELESFFTFTEQNNKSKYRHINSKSNANKKQHLMIWDFYNSKKHDIIDHIENNLEYPDIINNLQTLTKDAHKAKTYYERTGSNNAVHNLNDKKTWRHNVSVGATGLNNSNSNGLSSLEIIIKCQEYMTKNNINKMTSKLQEDLSNNELSGILPKSFSKNRFKGSRKYFRDCVNGLINLIDIDLDYIPEKKKSEILTEFENIKQKRFNYIDKHFYEYENNNINLKGLFVIDIKECGEEDVYDLTVEDNHNFYIITSTEDDKYENCQGILVHNCSEIALPSSADESFVCCLSSMNLELYDEWEHTDAVYWATLFLDAVMSDFIEKTEGLKHMEATHNFAKRHRALGLGVMGYHSYLQKNMIPFESFAATRINAKIFKQLKDQAYDASQELMEKYGAAPIFEELKDKLDRTEIIEVRRNTTLIAIAPTTSSSSILGQVSPGIEPHMTNYFKVGLAKGNFMRANKYLKNLIIKKGEDNEETWSSIMMHAGSVQHLEFLTDEEKSVFKTFQEISPMEIISQAAQRQKFIDQSQSLNLLIPSSMPVKDVNFLYTEAWKKGVKTLYYQRSTSVSKEMMTNFVICNACEA